MAAFSYCYATAGGLWTLRFDQFDPEIGAAPALEDNFRAIAMSFHVIEPGPSSMPRRRSHVGERSRAPEHSESGSYSDSS